MRNAVRSRRFALASALALNLVPVVGVFALGWELFPVLALYWVEAVVYVCRSAVEALFAAKPVGDEYLGLVVPLERLREKRGAVTVADWLPPVYPRNVPFALQAGWLLFALFALGTLVVLYARPPGALAGSALLGVAVGAVVALVRHASTLFASIRDRRYENESALSTFSRRRWIAIAILAFLVPVLGVGGTESELGLTATFLLVLAGKAGFELLDARGDDAADHPDHVSRLVDSTDRIAVPDGDPLAVVGTDARAVVLDALVLGALLSLLPPVGFAVVFLAIAAGLWAGAPAAVAVFAGLVLARTLLEIPIARLLHGNLEYRVYGDAVVAYDTFLDAPQWRVPRSEISAVRTRTALSSTLLSGSFGKVRLERADDSSRSLSVVSDPEELARRLSH